MFAIIQNNKKQILLTFGLILLLPVFVFLGETIMTLGEITGTALRMYVEGVCIK